MSVHPIEGMLGVSMEKIKEMVDVNTVIGESITTPDGTVIIPVSKVSFGFGSGGSDFPNKRDKDIFGGGTGAGLCAYGHENRQRYRQMLSRHEGTQAGLYSPSVLLCFL